jgi:hypothetical protein
MPKIFKIDEVSRIFVYAPKRRKGMLAYEEFIDKGKGHT